MTKRTTRTTVVIGALLALALAGCKDDEDGGGGGGGASVEVSAEMKDFLGGMGSSSQVAASLSKHGAGGLETQDMEMYDLTSPKVTAHEKRDAQDCYTFDAKAGVTTRTYVACWEGGKIVAVEDRGMR
jgi:hypothetical protein